MPNLTPKQKAVITTRLMDGVSVRAIAAELNINKNTYNLFQNQKSSNTAFYLENTTDNVANFCY
jgi:FixJ family two-component response regulator